jgi:hypothetical protein
VFHYVTITHINYCSWTATVADADIRDMYGVHAVELLRILISAVVSVLVEYSPQSKAF